MSEKIDILKTINDIDFSKTENFNIEEYYNAIKELETQSTDKKIIDAEERVKNAVESALIDNDTYTYLTTCKENIFSFFRKNDPNSEEVKALSEADKNKLYAIAKYLLSGYVEKLNSLKFNLQLTYDEVKFLDITLTRKLEYSANDIFTYTELRERYWNGVQEILSKLEKNDTSLYTIDITSVTYIQHLITNFKTNGISKDYIMFRNVVYKLNEISVVFESVKTLYERLNSNFTVWTSGISAEN